MASGTGFRARIGSLAIDTRPLRTVAYRRLFLASTVTSIGTQLTRVAVPIQVFAMTGSSAYVGLASVFALIPLVVFALWGGAIADTVDRRKLLIGTNVGIAITSVLLWVQAFAGFGSLWLLFLLHALQQGLFGVNGPARNASIARVVPEHLLPQAAALNMTMMTFGALLGPMIASALIPVIGLSMLYLIDALALLATLWAVWKMPSLPPLSGQVRTAGLRDVLDGCRYFLRHKVLLAAMLADLIAMIAGMPRALFPQMASETFGDPGGGVALGLLYAAIPAGSVLAGLTSGWISRVHRHGVAVTFGVLAWGIAMIGFGLSGSLPLAVSMLVLGGIADTMTMIFRSAILQSAATDEMRGRMQGLFVIVVTGGPSLADAVHGGAAAVVGTAAATAGGGVLVVVCMSLAALLLPAFLRYRAVGENR
ncbi:MFS transporter [Sciscionella marina]|uniref:MFS transporter n=1 Tax=Sciscionella marina TaxID=508770 RepID=UPI00035D6BB4|nr:MFS transporter [Sciscionella marina]